MSWLSTYLGRPQACVRLELCDNLVSTPPAMETADSAGIPMPPDFEDEALRFLPNVTRYARLLTRDAADAEDLTQETFLRAYENWGTFRPGSDCRRWLFTICRNIYLRDRQRAQRFVAADDPEQDLQAARRLFDQAYSDGLTGLFDRIDLGPAVERGLAGLPAEYREALILVDVEDRTYASAAHAAGVPVGTIRSRLFRARRLLQETLLEYARDMGLAAAAHVTDPGPNTSQEMAS
jgi:RNA polymerase sigma-70 factor, ECF subfamily